ncbi:MAG: hypothetical protein LKF42_08770 [Streptococcaceae bacterium]|jgi:hypothetical protein|nr:hypothetical protein [Streptococcaceae bacterium]MCH4177284.1 hypothetical protein [Streptococcaceae bacterium]
MSELTEKINAEIDKFGDMGEYGVCAGLKVARDVIEEHELQHKIELNQNQQVVLDWLKMESKESFSCLDGGLSRLDDLFNGDCYIGIYAVWTNLPTVEAAQVLQVFSAWVIEQEGE